MSSPSRRLTLIDRGILDASIGKGLPAFDASGAFSAVVLATYVSGISVGEIDTELCASACDFGF